MPQTVIGKINELAQDEDLRAFLHKPGSEHKFSVNGIDYEILINENGYRDTSFVQNKAPNTFRVLAIGDLQSLLAKDKSSMYTSILEEELRKQTTALKLEVINLAVAESTPSYWLLRSKELFSYNPDVIIHFQSGNEILREHAKWQGRASPIESVLRQSRIISFFFPIDVSKFTLFFQRSIEHHKLLSKKAEEHRATYIVCETPAPSLPRKFSQADRKLIASVIHSQLHSFKVLFYRDYFNLLTHYNAILRQYAKAKYLNLYYTSRVIFNEEDFIDHTHLSSVGYRKFAMSLVPVLLSSIPNERYPVHEY